MKTRPSRVKLKKKKVKHLNLTYKSVSFIKIQETLRFPFLRYSIYVCSDYSPDLNKTNLVTFSRQKYLDFIFSFIYKVGAPKQSSLNVRR